MEKSVDTKVDKKVDKKMDNSKEAYKKQAALSAFHFLTEAVNLVIVIVTAITSRSLIIWLDFINSLGNTMRVGLMAVFSRSMTKKRKPMNEADLVKSESRIAFFCNGLVLVGLIVTFILSIIQIIQPKDASESMLWAIMFKFFCVVFDTPILVMQYKIRKQNNNQVTTSGFIGAVTAFLFDAVALLSVCIVFFTRNVPGCEYISPILSLIIAVVLMVICIREIIDSVHALKNKLVSYQTKIRILSIIDDNFKNTDIFEDINPRYSQETIFIDISLKLDNEKQEMSVKQIAQTLQEKFGEEIDNCVVTLTVA